MSIEECAIHPSTRAQPHLSLAERARAEMALAWLRQRLSETAIGVHLDAYQVAIAPNRTTKHAAWAKRVNDDGLTRRQFIRLYGTGTVRQPGKHFVTLPLL